MKTKQELIGNWVLKADNDLKAAQHELSFEDDAVTDSVCFHCQQAAEKYIKAYLIFFDIPFKKTHDIGDLILLCEARDPEIALLEDEVDLLADFGVEVRYPDNFFIPTLNEAKDAYSLAQKDKGVY